LTIFILRFIEIKLKETYIIIMGLFNQVIKLKYYIWSIKNSLEKM